MRRVDALTTEQVELLEALPSWTWDAKEESWRQHVTSLRAFVASKGRIPRRGETEEALWLNQMRGSYREGVLPQDKIATLEAIPGWSWHAHQTSWDEHFEVLSSYAQREGHALPLVDWVEEGVPIGKWASKQRHAYVKGRLSTNVEQDLSPCQAGLGMRTTHGGIRTTTRWSPSPDGKVTPGQRGAGSRPA